MMKRLARRMGILPLLLAPAAACAFVRVGDGWDGPGRNPHVVHYYFGDFAALQSTDHAAAKAAFQRAMRAWSEATSGNLTFSEVFEPNQPNTIDIVWIDEPGHFPDNGVAHSYYAAPPNPESYAGDIHLNPRRQWAAGDQVASSAFQIERVAVHEIGHALGMDHSGISSAVMYGTVQTGEVFSGLSADDIEGICTLYLCSPRQPNPVPLALIGLYGIAHARRCRHRP